MTHPDPRIVPVLRLALLGGAGLLGVVVGLLHPEPPANAADVLSSLTLAGRVIWGIAIVGCLVIASRVRNERDPGRRLSLSIVGWALAESVAVFGAVLWYLSGSSQWYFPGLGFLALALVMLPGVARDA
jgi:hypothetical protein